MNKANASCRNAWRWLSREPMYGRPLVVGLLLAMSTAIAVAQPESIAPAATEDGISIYFSPGNNVTEAITRCHHTTGVTGVGCGNG